jgi:hypothetical protein
MVSFSPAFTEVVYLDTECYVPPEERSGGLSSLILNRAKKVIFY